MSSELHSTPLADLTLNEAARPSAPKVPQATDADRSKGRQLAMMHRHYLQDMARIKMVIDRIEAGDAPPAELSQIVLNTDMAQNYRAFGSLCGQQCHVLTMHHNIEEAHMFPGIDAAAPSGFAAVVAKLRAEHKVVHELLDRLAAAAQTLDQSPTESTFTQVRAIFDKLHDATRKRNSKKLSAST